MLHFVYSFVILIATTLGAFVGLGGGVIIKPLLDFIGKDTRVIVDFLSCVAVLTMSIVSTGKAIKIKQEFDKSVILLLSSGSIAGGWAGNFVMDKISEFTEQNMVRGIQAAVLAVLLVFVCLYMSFGKKSFKVKNKFLIAFTGLCLGFTASFLGIGGGPINVVVLTLFFSFCAKDAAVYSVAIIFFSQLTKLITMLVGNGLHTYSGEVKVLAFILPAAVIGGFIGSALNRIFSSNVIKKVFSVCMACLVILNFYNSVNYFFIAG